jgi:hypothetical protein
VVYRIKSRLSVMKKLRFPQILGWYLTICGSVIVCACVTSCDCPDMASFQAVSVDSADFVVHDQRWDPRAVEVIGGKPYLGSITSNDELSEVVFDLFRIGNGELREATTVTWRRVGTSRVTRSRLQPCWDGDVCVVLADESHEAVALRLGADGRATIQWSGTSGPRSGLRFSDNHLIVVDDKKVTTIDARGSARDYPLRCDTRLREAGLHNVIVPAEGNLCDLGQGRVLRRYNAWPLKQKVLSLHVEDNQACVLAAGPLSSERHLEAIVVGGDGLITREVCLGGEPGWRTRVSGRGCLLWNLEAGDVRMVDGSDRRLVLQWEPPTQSLFYMRSFGNQVWVTYDEGYSILRLRASGGAPSSSGARFSRVRGGEDDPIAR